MSEFIKNFEDKIEETEADGIDGLEVSFDDYQVTTSPNDFNLSSLVDFIDKGVLIIPGFQRNYVWDKKRASKLIESITLSLPIPQIFLYEIDSKFLVIDGQQRLMSIYYFRKGRFPQKEKRAEIRSIYFSSGNKIPNEKLSDPKLFEDFKLYLSRNELGKTNRLHGLSYSSFGENQAKFDLKTIRTITIKQNFPENDDSSMFEIFNRLNTGGVHLKPQEIRMSMYNSDFYKLLEQLNSASNWRKILREEKLDIHMKDIEILLRGISMLIREESYGSSMVSFLNKVSKEMKSAAIEDLDLLGEIAKNFFEKNKDVDLFRSKRFNISLFESVFVTSCRAAWRDRIAKDVKSVSPIKVEELKNNSDFNKFISQDTTGKEQVKKRLELAGRILANE